MPLTQKTFEKYGLVSLGAKAQKRSYRGRIGIASVGAFIIAVLCWIKIYDNFHVIVENEAYRSGQISSHELRRYIDQHGLKSVISLRANTQAVWWIRERAACEEAGVAHFDVPLRGRDPLTPQKIELLLSTMEAAPKPVVIHCRHGADRAGMAAALYLRVIKNEPMDVAAKELSATYGHLPLLFPPVRKYDAAFRDLAERPPINAR